MLAVLPRFVELAKVLFGAVISSFGLAISSGDGVCDVCFVQLFRIVCRMPHVVEVLCGAVN